MDQVITKWLPAAVNYPAAGSSEKSLERPGDVARTETATPGDLPLLFTVSVESEDRAADMILASGWDLSGFERNPVVLWAHRHSDPPVGRAIRAWVEGTSLMALIEFAPTPFAQQVKKLYDTGFLRGVSVGFRALETEPRTGANGRRGVLFKRQELLEISAAPVPLHPAALVSERGTGTQIPQMGQLARKGDEGFVEALGDIRALWEEVAEAV